jgi:hypothetical protein
MLVNQHAMSLAGCGYPLKCTRYKAIVGEGKTKTVQRYTTENMIFIPLKLAATLAPPMANPDLSPEAPRAA